MALVQLSFKSKALMLQTPVNILLPVGMNTIDAETINDYSYEFKRFPVLYLLHGGTDDYSSWLRLSSIERYAEEKGIAVVMPNADMSAYTDMVHGQKYWTYISEELPQFLKATFPISDKREETFVAGLSLGGYGAFKLALSKPENFAAAASLSGALDMFALVSKMKAFETVFGDVSNIPNSNNDLFYLLKQVKNSEVSQPKLFQACGTEDFLYEDNVKFRDYAVGIDKTYTFEEGPGGHEWEYWDTNIKRVLDWLPLQS